PTRLDALARLDAASGTTCQLIRLIPAWYADAGPISIYYANRTLLPSKTRVFIDFLTEVFQRERWPERFAGTLG
ncbi:LysR family transcriptional regulator, partial [Rhizobium leguminosarum]